MIESQVRALFTAIASSEPGASQVDTQLAHRRGRARLRWRRAWRGGHPGRRGRRDRGRGSRRGSGGPTPAYRPGK